MKQRIINILNDHRQRIKISSGRIIYAPTIEIEKFDSIADDIAALLEREQPRCKLPGKMRLVFVDKNRKIC